MNYTNILAISPSEEMDIISSARTAVGICVRNYADKTGFKNAFTKEDIEDIIGDTTFRACRSFSTFNKSKAKLSTWVNSIAINTFRNAIDYKMKRRHISCEFVEEDPNSGNEYSLDEVRCNPQDSYFGGWTRVSEETADRELLQKDFEAYVSDSLPDLSERDRKFLEWMKLGYTASEMSAMDGCSPNAASKRMWTIRQAIGKRATEIIEGVRLTDMKAAC